MHIQVDDREFDTIVAALSLWQYLALPETFPGIDGHRLRQLRAMTEEHGPALTDDEIEELAQRMNMGDLVEDSPFLTLGDIVATIIKRVEPLNPDNDLIERVMNHFDLSEQEWENIPGNVKDALVMLMATETSKVPVAMRQP